MLLAAGLAAAGCGAEPMQDADEPEGTFPLQVIRAQFPQQQSLARDSRLEIEVRNVGSEPVPNINVTIDGFDRKELDPANPARTDPSAADPERPVFVVDKSPVEFLRNRFPVDQSLVDREVNPTYGRQTAYVDTYSLGELAPGETALFRWDVSAVDAGDYRIDYEINAGMDGNAEAIGADGQQPAGSFAGTIEAKPPTARVAPDGRTIVSSDGRRNEDNRGVIR